MGYVIPAGFSRVSFDYTSISPLGSQPSWGIGVDVPPSDGLLDVMQEWWNDDLRTATDVDYTLIRIEARNDFIAIERPVGEAGALSATFCSPQVALLTSLTSPAVGRANRGRMYWPGVLPELYVTSQGVIEPTFAAGLRTKIEHLVDAVASLDGSLVILHSVEGVPSPVTNVTMQGQVATQRRRMRR
uniref:Uncharacterized protein n=1 Tax=uncultured prokaryote TaxID=198431 RepID=A0A0H5Q635_9ZZZZ|nr:hypothetical protein [uncultured prokaryote]